MILEKAMENLKYDSRLIEYNLQRGIISKEEWLKHLNSIPDSTDNVFVSSAQYSPSGDEASASDKDSATAEDGNLDAIDET